MANTKDIKDYSIDFDGNLFLEKFYSEIIESDREPGLFAFTLKSLHHIFSSGNLKGKTLLDIGTGPAIHSVISACPYVQEIFLSDYAESNRKILRDWLHGTRQYALEPIKFIVNLEKNKFCQTTEDRLTEIKQKIKDIIPADVMKCPPVEFQNIIKPDIIISSLCFEVACQTVKEYYHAVQNVGSLLTSGGHLVIVGVLEETFYSVGDVTFPCVCITQEELEKAYKTNGFDIKTWKEFIPLPRNQEEAKISDFHKAFVMHAVKL